MKTTFTAIAVVMALAAAARATPEGWLTDFEQARTRAKETGRPILVNFSGSDWCGWCIRLDKQVLQKPEFKTYAKDSLVLFNADFPRQTKLPENLARQNQTLAERYSVEGFPTVLLLNAKGRVIGRTGYRAGGPEAYVAHLRELIAKQASAPGKTEERPTPWKYDAENNRYWNPDRGHWHDGRPPEGK